MKEKLLVLGTGPAQLDLIQYAKEAGYEVHGVSARTGDIGESFLDYFEEIDIRDALAVCAYAKKHHIDLVYSVGSDVSLPTIAKVSTELHLPHFVSEATAKTCCTKHLMREALGSDFEGNLSFKVCQTKDEALSIDSFPCIIKPVDSQGQRGVYKVTSQEEMAECFEAAIHHSKDKRVIVERYIEGDELSVNAFLHKGKVVLSFLSDRESYKDLPGGIIKAHHLPSCYETSEVHEKIKSLVSRVTEKLGIFEGPAYFQIKVHDGSPYLLEVTPRLDGCHMWRLIKAFSGVDLLSLTMHDLVGAPLKVPQVKKSKTPFHTEFFCKKPDTVFDASLYEEKNALYKSFYYQTGECVRAMNGYMEKCGYRIIASPQKVALVGGSGFLGKNFLHMFGSLLDITDVSRKSRAVKAYSEQELMDALKDFDSVVILAAKKVDTTKPDVLATYLDNVSVVEKTLAACEKLGIQNVVVASSRMVYNPSQPSPVKESGAIAPSHSYGISKYAAELVCRAYTLREKMNIKVLRIAQVLGDDGSSYMANVFFRKALEGAPLVVHGRALGKKDYIYVKDVCEGIYQALMHYEAQGTYNIGSGRGSSALDLAKAAVCGCQSSSKIVQDKTLPEDDSVCFLDVQKAKDELGFAPAFSLEEAFSDMKSVARKAEEGIREYSI